MNETLGIVLYSIEYKEKGKIVYLFTKDGIKGIKVSNALNPKSHNLAFCNTLNVVSYIATDTEFPSLKEYDVIFNSFDLTNDLVKIKACYTIVKVLKNIKLENISINEKYLKFVISFLEKFKVCNNPNRLLAIFLIKSLKMFGVEPNFSSCLICKNPNTVFFSVIDGGVYCYKCKNEINENGLYADFHDIYFLKNNYEQYQIKCELSYLLRKIKEYYQTHVNLMLDI